VNARVSLLKGIASFAANPSQAGRPLFHRAIMESGPVSADWTTAWNMSKVEAQFAFVQHALGCTGSVACMREASAESVLAASDHAPSSMEGVLVDCGWAPVLDGASCNYTLSLCNFEL
jgi:carboxylesterase type B